MIVVRTMIMLTFDINKHGYPPMHLFLFYIKITDLQKYSSPNKLLAYMYTLTNFW